MGESQSGEPETMQASFVGVPLNPPAKTTLESLEVYKRFLIASALLGIFGLAVFGLLCVAGLAAYKGQYVASLDALKWLLGILVGIIGGVVGYYFGSHNSGGGA